MSPAVGARIAGDATVADWPVPCGDATFVSIARNAGSYGR
jgi:hypothetical protein